MNGKEFQKHLTSAIPDVPEHFHNRMEMTLESIVNQEANMKESTKKAIRTAGRFSFRTAVLALALVMAVSAVALAATQWHLFDHIPHLTGDGTPKNADSVMQGNLYQETVNNVEITVKEAGYDGRTLFLQYSFRMLDVDKTFSKTELSEEDERMLFERGVGWWIDTIWINGKAMDIPNGSQSGMTGSDVPGELVVTDVWRLDNEGFSLNGPIQISLPIGACQNLSDYSRKSHPEKYDVDGSLKLPEQGMVTFTYDAKDILSQVQVVHPEQERVLPEVTVRVKETAFSPLMTYITLDLKVNPDALAAFIAANGEGPKNEQGEVMWPYGGMDVFQDWIFSLELVDGQGNLVFPGHAGQNGYSNEWAEFLYPYLENIPAELYLAPIEDGVADMSQAVLVKPVNQ